MSSCDDFRQNVISSTRDFDTSYAQIPVAYNKRSAIRAPSTTATYCFGITLKIERERERERERELLFYGASTAKVIIARMQ